MLCPHCHNDTPDASPFCGYCGGALTEEPAPAKPRAKKWWLIPVAVILIAAIGIGVWWFLTNKPSTEEPTAQPAPQEEDIPAYAMIVNGTEISKELYSAWLYGEFYNLYYGQGLFQYESYGIDPWCQTFSYGEEAEELPLAEYITRLAQDGIIRAEAVRQWADEQGITPDEKELARLDREFATIDEQPMKAYGFTKEDYRTYYIDYNLYEQALFYTLHENADEEDVRAFYDEHFVAYYRLDADDSDKSLQTLLADYQKGIDVFADTNVFFDDDVTSDSAFVQAIQALSVGDAAVLTLEDSEALILRVDPAEADPAHYENSWETIVYGLYFDTFDGEVNNRIEALTVEYNDKLLSDLNPKDFLTIAEEQQAQDEKEDLLSHKGTPLTFRDEDGNVLLTRSDVRDAHPGMDAQNDTYIVTISFTEDGAKRLEDATRQTLGKSLNICFDETILMAPAVLAVITGGEVVLTFDDYDTAAIYAELINSAK